MLEFERSGDLPQLRIRCGRQVLFSDLVHTAPALERALERLRPGDVVTCDASRLKDVDGEAVGVLCYLVLRTLRTSPGAVIAAVSPVAAATAVCSFARRADTGGCIQIVERSDEITAAVAGLRTG